MIDLNRLEKLTKGQMIGLMIIWAAANAKEDDSYSLETGEQRALTELCTDALHASGRDDRCGCILCRS